ncbi:MAG: SMC-Scp complex subunit ScpB [Spirochaetes bacterium]|nr:SMC-Scp complex subunit ScpB [Spirochaetota bacterium]
MVEDDNVALIGAILFLESEPASEESLSAISGLAAEDVVSALRRLSVESEAPFHGFAPLKSGGGWILAPKVEVWEKLRDHYGRKNEAKLSRAAMETLSIIAYSQPITRAEIEAIRGVSADGMVRFLLSRGFIQEVGKKDIPGKPLQYGTTQDFLKYFKLGSISDLPKLGDLERNRFEADEGAIG